jgi:hypothetical protein
MISFCRGRALVAGSAAGAGVSIASGAGTWIVFWHCGHSICVPRICASASRFCEQCGHAKVIKAVSAMPYFYMAGRDGVKPREQARK